jgi:hypothetical protein
MTITIAPYFSAESDLRYIQHLARQPPPRQLDVLFPGEERKGGYPPFDAPWTDADIAADGLVRDQDALLADVCTQFAELGVDAFFDRFRIKPPSGAVRVHLTRYGCGGSYDPLSWSVTCNLFHLFPTVAKKGEQAAVRDLPADAFGKLDPGVLLHELVHLFVAPVFIAAWRERWNDPSNGNHFRVEQTVDLLLNSGELAKFFPPSHPYHRPPFFKAQQAPSWGES